VAPGGSESVSKSNMSVMKMSFTDDDDCVEVMSVCDAAAVTKSDSELLRQASTSNQPDRPVYVSYSFDSSSSSDLFFVIIIIIINADVKNVKTTIITPSP